MEPQEIWYKLPQEIWANIAKYLPWRDIIFPDPAKPELRRFFSDQHIISDAIRRAETYPWEILSSSALGPYAPGSDSLRHKLLRIQHDQSGVPYRKLDRVVTLRDDVFLEGDRLFSFDYNWTRPLIQMNNLSTGRQLTMQFPMGKRETIITSKLFAVAWYGVLQVYSHDLVLLREFATPGLPNDMVGDGDIIVTGYHDDLSTKLHIFARGETTLDLDGEARGWWRTLLLDAVRRQCHIFYIARDRYEWRFRVKTINLDGTWSSCGLRTFRIRDVNRDHPRAKAKESIKAVEVLRTGEKDRWIVNAFRGVHVPSIYATEHYDPVGQFLVSARPFFQVTGMLPRPTPPWPTLPWRDNGYSHGTKERNIAWVNVRKLGSKKIIHRINQGGGTILKIFRNESWLVAIVNSDGMEHGALFAEPYCYDPSVVAANPARNWQEIV